MLRQLIEGIDFLDDLLRGPPAGKTTLASIIAGRTKANFINFSCDQRDPGDQRSDEPEESRRMGRGRFFLWTIHRFNKAQQDAFLCILWRRAAKIILIGATRESVLEVNAALLSSAGCLF